MSEPRRFQGAIGHMVGRSIAPECHYATPPLDFEGGLARVIVAVASSHAPEAEKVALATGRVARELQ